MLYKKKILNQKFRHFILDLDGVVFNTKNNMKIAWNKTRKKFNIKQSFSRYFCNIGIPFEKILHIIGIKKDIHYIEKIKNYYKLISIQNNHHVKIYKDVKKTFLNIKKSKDRYISIVTSKDLIRSKKLLKKFNLKFDSLHCPTSKIPGKPNPALILKSLNKIRIKKKYVCYVGDTRFDQIAAKKAGISFVYANYGYGNLRQKKLLKISSFSQLENFF